MPTKKSQQILLKHRVCSIARIVACASFLVLTVIAISSLVRAMSLENISQKDGIPTAWNVGSLGHPASISVPITYWDQREDQCWTDGKTRNNNDYRNMSASEVDRLLVANRQFEWSHCGIYGPGVVQGLVKDRLGSDGLPVAAYANTAATKKAGVDITSQFVTQENFYRWFHEVEGKSQKITGRKITFTRGEGNSYTYGGSGRNIFPLDDVDFSDGDTTNSAGNNFHFTAHLRIPIKIGATGRETFDFAGDDDVWVFVNGKLVLDIGGVHSRILGHFTINSDGTIDSEVDDGETKTNRSGINAGIKAGDVVNLDFFYAERSTTESNTLITISEMNWPISADSTLEGQIVGQLAENQTNLIEYTASVTNRDPENPLKLDRIAAYMKDTSYTTSEDGNTTSSVNSGFLPLDIKTLKYSTNPSDDDSWKPVEISKPQNSTSGFTLATPLSLAPAGTSGDTLYFRYYAESSTSSGQIDAQIDFMTNLDGMQSVTYNTAVVKYDPVTSSDDEDNKTEQNTETHKVTINYVYADAGEDAEPAADPYEATLSVGAGFTVPSPVVDGYTPDKASVTGQIDDEDITITVVYTKNEEETQEPESYKVTINYVYDDENQTVAADPYEATLESGSEFSVPSPAVDGYTPSQLGVIGTVENSDISITVIYTKDKEPETHTLTIRYEYADGSVAAQTHYAVHEPGAEFSIVSPEIEGYIANQPTVSGLIAHENLLYTVVYTAEEKPVVPPSRPTVTPTLPILPVITPTTPSEPVTPDVDFGIDDSLTYLPPLGEVAFIPNTGVIDQMIAPIFEQYFADLILSQGFVMSILLIFSASFATYFSLRRYLNPAMLTRTVSARKAPKMPRKVAKKTITTKKAIAPKKTAKRTKK